MSNQHYLHFTLGPVQGFVSQARRTRDFWAGSFLLSWLTAKAMVAVQDAGGKIIMPSVDGDALLKRVTAASGVGPTIGSLPNNFIAEVSKDFEGKVAVDAVQKAWKALADKVWKKDQLRNAGVSRPLWDEQIGNFWDMAWVVSDSDDASVLAMRKNWRSYMPPEQMGDKCTMMGEWQELSGADKPNPNQQCKFWSQLNPYGTMDLRENERLCAIAYVKRRFVHVWHELAGHLGWTLPSSVPSTSYMAAVHWLEALIQAAPARKNVEVFLKATEYGEKLTRIACISNALNNAPNHLQDLAYVDGRALFPSDKSEDKSVNDARKNMLETVEGLDAPLSPFYAILMMDGDSLGETKKRLAEAGGSATALSEALAEFTKAVPKEVANHNGFLIYAGGDDVLAILPLEDALPCAVACRQAYQQAFGDQPATISAAIEYAHMKLPLTMILKDAHTLLDDVAKDGTGRDAVACRVWKPGGVQQTWAMPWKVGLDSHGGIIMHDLAIKLGTDEAGDPGYASKLLYHIRETLEMLEGGAQFSPASIQKMLVTDYISSGLLEGVKDKVKVATALIEPLLMQCMEFINKTATGRYKADGALLLRFLAQKGVER